MTPILIFLKQSHSRWARNKVLIPETLWNPTLRTYTVITLYYSVLSCLAYFNLTPLFIAFLDENLTSSCHLLLAFGIADKNVLI